MSTLTVENMLKLYEQMPVAEQQRLRALLIEQEPKTKPPLNQRVPCEPMPDRTREHEWVKTHKQEYAGQWVALDGDRLVAASPSRLELSEAVKADGGSLPLILRVPSPEDLPYVGI